ncbi:MAG TPA: hypothetical protein VFX13_14365 [Gaiellales bacterium]|jgi:hypothetical protein|nr:hypothetical protein [Gaiellales bacterium]
MAAVVSRKLTLTEPFLTGADVRAAQRALHTNRFGIDFGPGRADSQFGRKTADATRLAKFLLGYPRAEVNREFGPNLYGYLVPKGAPGYRQRPPGFVAPSVARRTQFRANAPVRTRLVGWCTWGIENNAEIHYEQARPIPVDHLPGTLPLTTDCSGSTTLFARWAGAPDPNGMGYDGSGSTMAMLANMRRIRAAQALAGDLIVFDGPPAEQHVVVLLEKGSEADPLVASHGSERGPLELRLSDERAAHAGLELVHLSLD